MGCGASSPRTVDVGGEIGSPLSGQGSSFGELRGSSLGPADTANLRILETAEQHGHGAKQNALGAGASSEPPARLILVGAGGVGKTTLMRSLAHSFDDEPVHAPLVMNAEDPPSRLLPCAVSGTARAARGVLTWVLARCVVDGPKRRCRRSGRAPFLPAA